MTSNDLQSSILLKIGVDLLKTSQLAKNLANRSKNVEDMAITNFGPKVSKSPPLFNFNLTIKMIISCNNRFKANLQKKIEDNLISVSLMSALNRIVR